MAGFIVNTGGTALELGAETWPNAFIVNQSVVVAGVLEDGGVYTTYVAGFPLHGTVPTWGTWNQTDGLLFTHAGQFERWAHAGAVVVAQGFNAASENTLWQFSVNAASDGTIAAGADGGDFDAYTSYDELQINGWRGPAVRFAENAGSSSLTIESWGETPGEFAAVAEADVFSVPAYDGVVTLFDYPHYETTPGDPESVTITGEYLADTDVYLFAKDGPGNTSAALSQSFWESAEVSWGVKAGGTAPAGDVQLTLAGGTPSSIPTWKQAPISSGGSSYVDSGWNDAGVTGDLWWAGLVDNYRSEGDWTAALRGLYVRVLNYSGGSPDPDSPYSDYDVTITGMRDTSTTVVYRNHYAYKGIGWSTPDVSLWQAPAIEAFSVDTPQGVAVVAKTGPEAGSDYTLALYRTPPEGPAIDGELGPVRRRFT